MRHASRACVKMASGEERSVWFSSALYDAIIMRWIMTRPVVQRSIASSDAIFRRCGRMTAFEIAPSSHLGPTFVHIPARLRLRDRTTVGIIPWNEQPVTQIWHQRITGADVSYVQVCVVALVVRYARAKIRARHETESHLNAIFKVTREFTSVALTPLRYGSRVFREN